ncbi:MAG TPA: amidohydrolase family protein, partial [Burkholderiaceae bacterium]
MTLSPDTIFIRGRITTMAGQRPEAQALAVRDGVICAIGDNRDVAALAGGATRRIDLGGRRVVPGLVETHKHPAIAATAYCVELRWDGLPTIFDALGTIREQVRRDPPPRLIRVVGGFLAPEVAEKRLPTLEEINEVAPDTPVFVMHLFDECILNAAAARALGFADDSADPTAGRLIRSGGTTAGFATSRPAAAILSASLASRAADAPTEKERAMGDCERWLLSFGVTSLDHPVARQADISEARASGRLRTSAELPAWRPLVEAARVPPPSDAPAPFAFSLSDFEDFRRTSVARLQEEELFEFVRTLAAEQRRFRMHVTDERA